MTDVSYDDKSSVVRQVLWAGRKLSDDQEESPSEVYLPGPWTMVEVSQDASEYEQLQAHCFGQVCRHLCYTNTLGDAIYLTTNSHRRLDRVQCNRFL